MALPRNDDSIWYAHAKLQSAVHSSASSGEPALTRLREVRRIITAVLPSDLPEDIGTTLTEFRAGVSFAGSETFDHLTHVECTRLLSMVCDIDSAVTAHLLAIARRGK